MKWFVLGPGNMYGRPELALKIIKEFLCPQPHFIPPVSWWASSSTAVFPSSSSFSLRRFTLCQRALPAVSSPSSAISSQACSFSFSPSTSQVNYSHRVGFTLFSNWVTCCVSFEYDLQLVIWFPDSSEKKNNFSY